MRKSKKFMLIVYLLLLLTGINCALPPSGVVQGTGNTIGDKSTSTSASTVTSTEIPSTSTEIPSTYTENTSTSTSTSISTDTNPSDSSTSDTSTDTKSPTQKPLFAKPSKSYLASMRSFFHLTNTEAAAVTGEPFEDQRKKKDDVGDVGVEGNVKVVFREVAVPGAVKDPLIVPGGEVKDLSNQGAVEQATVQGTVQKQVEQGTVQQPAVQSAPSKPVQPNTPIQTPASTTPAPIIPSQPVQTAQSKT